MNGFAPRGAYERGRQNEHGYNNNGDYLFDGYYSVNYSDSERRQEMTFEERDELTRTEQKFVNMLRGKNPEARDQILNELERNLKNGDTLRNDSTGNGTL